MRLNLGRPVGASRGIALLEVAVVTTILVPLFLALLGAAQFSNAWRVVETIADKHVADIESHPYELRDWDVYLLLRKRIDKPSDPHHADHAFDLDKQSSQIADRIESELLASLGNVIGSDANLYRVEVAWRMVPITTDTGLVSGDAITKYKNISGKVEARGNLSGTGVSLDHDLDQLLALYKFQNPSSPGVFPFAVPSAIYNTCDDPAPWTGCYAPHEAKQSYDEAWSNYQAHWSREFVRSTMLWGVRVTVSLENSLAGWFASALDKDDTTTATPLILTSRRFVPSRSVM